MKISEIVENVTPVFTKKGNKSVRKYRCTSGSRKGRVVAKPNTCTAPKNVKASQTMKKTRRSKSSSQAQKNKITRRSNTASLISGRINRAKKRSRNRSRRKKI